MNVQAVKRMVAALVTGGLILAMMGGSAGSTERARLPPPPPDPEDAVRPPAAIVARQKAIEAELERIGVHAWAGEYSEGDGLGANLRLSLAPQAGIAGTLTGCLGLYDARAGSVEESPGVLKFHLDGRREQTPWSFPDELVPVRWGERRYLIPPADLMRFVNAIHRGFEPRTDAMGMFLLARGDEKKPADGLPELPEPYRSAIRDVPLDVGVVAVQPAPLQCGKGGFCTRIHRFTVDRGTLDGIVPGVELEVKSPDDAVDTLLIESADATTAVGSFTRYSDDNDEDAVKPDRRWVFTTGRYTPAAR